jgi:hypothetical protein
MDDKGIDLGESLTIEETTYLSQLAKEAQTTPQSYAFNHYLQVYLTKKYELKEKDEIKPDGKIIRVT